MPEMTSRERVLAALDHQETDRIPIAMVCGGINPPAMRALDTFLQMNRGIDGHTYINAFLDVAEVWVTGEFNQEMDLWGVGRKEIRHLRKNSNQAIVLANANLFETAWYMRGLEQAFEDMMLQPDLIHYIMEKVTSFFIDYFFEILNKCRGEIDLVFTADDIGHQDGLLLSLDMWEEFLKPYHVRINEMIHNMGAKVIYHTDGAVSEAIPGLMDMGIDVLQALQFSAANMDPQHLKDHFGKDLCFEGGMCVQKVLPFGTIEEVREETRMLISVLGKNGGYLCGPSHFIQAGTPAENIVAYFDEARQFYPFR